MIKLRKFEEDSCELFDSNDKSIGVIDNELTLIDVRIQVMKQKAEGCYIVYKNNKHLLKVDGFLEDYPTDLFGKHRDLLDEILFIRIH